MANAQANALKVKYYKKAAVGGTVPTTAQLTRLRVTDPNLTPSVQTAKSQELRSDRATSDLTRTGGSSGGSVGFELSFREYDEFLAAALGGEFPSTVIAPAATSITFAASGTSDTSVAATGVFTHAAKWDSVRLSGNVAYNGVYRIKSKTSSDAVVLEGVLLTPATATDVQIELLNSVVISVTGATITSAHTLTKTGAFDPDALLPGMWLAIRTTSGSASNKDVPVRLASCTADAITVEGAPWTNEASKDYVIKGASVRNGIVKPVFFIEEEYSDLVGSATKPFIQYDDQMVNTLDINAASASFCTGSIGFMGCAAQAAAATKTTGDEITSCGFDVVNSTANLKNVVVADYNTGTALSGVRLKTLNLKLTNNGRALDEVGSLYPFDINQGSIDVTVAASCYFNDTTMLNNYIEGNPMKVSYMFSDANDLTGNLLVVDMPRVKLSAGGVNGKKLNSDVMNDATFTATNDPTLGYMVQFTLIPK